MLLRKTDVRTLEITYKIPLEKVIIEENMKSTIRPKKCANYLMNLGYIAILEPWGKFHT